MPTWVVVSAATAIALGTYVGGWRIIKTMGSRIIKMDTAQGFAAQGSGAAVILASSHVGFPLSTTHTISGAVIGLGRGQAAVGGPLGRGREHRRRLGAHAPGGGADRRRHLRRHAHLRHRRARAARGVGADPGGRRRCSRGAPSRRPPRRWERERIDDADRGRGRRRAARGGVGVVRGRDRGDRGVGRGDPGRRAVGGPQPQRANRRGGRLRPAGAAGPGGGRGGGRVRHRRDDAINEAVGDGSADEQPLSRPRSFHAPTDART